ncbi:hypothetical protein KM043_008629 [Ampulex compressa]|nr:hypothetical protein KM043_008629 [Ampulex compressa]
MVTLQDISYRLMQPVKDLADWNFPLSQVLEEYYALLEKPCDLNFGEAALVLQNSTNVYVKRIESLFDQAELLKQTYTSCEKETAKKDSRNEKKSNKNSIDFGDFQYLDLRNEVGKNIDLKSDSQKTVKLISRRFTQLEKNTALLDIPIEIYDIYGEVIGKKYDFRCNQIMNMNGVLVDELTPEDFNDTNVSSIEERRSSSFACSEADLERTGTSGYYSNASTYESSTNFSYNNGCPEESEEDCSPSPTQDCYCGDSPSVVQNSATRIVEEKGKSVSRTESPIENFRGADNAIDVRSPCSLKEKDRLLESCEERRKDVSPSSDMSQDNLDIDTGYVSGNPEDSPEVQRRRSERIRTSMRIANGESRNERKSDSDNTENNSCTRFKLPGYSFVSKSKSESKKRKKVRRRESLTKFALNELDFSRKKLNMFSPTRPKFPTLPAKEFEEFESNYNTHLKGQNLDLFNYEAVTNITMDLLGFRSFLRKQDPATDDLPMDESIDHTSSPEQSRASSPFVSRSKSPSVHEEWIRRDCSPLFDYQRMIEDRMKEIFAEADVGTELEHAVAKWHEMLQPKLTETERRPAFRIHDYSSRIVDTLRTLDERKAAFESIVQGEPACEVARYFLASLQLANMYNVEISMDKTGDSQIEIALLDGSHDRAAGEIGVEVVNACTRGASPGLDRRKIPKWRTPRRGIKSAAIMYEKSALSLHRGMVQPRMLLVLILIQFLIQFFTSTYLYTYMVNVETDLRILQNNECGRHAEKFTRRKRSSALPIAEDNAVSDTSRLRDDKEIQKESKKITVPPIVVSGSASPPVILGAQDWVWLNADTRIQFDAIENFCRSSSKYCPPGTPGTAGEPGTPGLRGLPGPKGPPGLSGQSGPRGPKGDIGPPGFEGRDGVPGEPGLDGIPGRSGLDGLPGINGKPGLNGSPGRPGRNGTDGRPGQMGPQGPPGQRGEMGPPGRPGAPGQDGRPGISAWKINLTSYDISDLLVPPSILDDSAMPSNSTSLISIYEGSNIRLRCAAAGKPEPVVQWSKTDGSAISTGLWHVTAVIGHTYNISVVNRDHMGEYTCIADNGVWPRAFKKFRLHVKFPPYIKIRNQMVLVRNQSTATLECEVEAFPDPMMMHWERGDGRRLKMSDKYRMEVYDKKDIYKLKMRLKIMRITSSDHGVYHCVVKNEVDVTKGSFIVDNNTKNFERLGLGKQQHVTYGKPMPQMVDLEELCSPQETCATCPVLKCAYTDIAEYVNVQSLRNVNATKLPPRQADGVIEAVGKPVLKGTMDDHYGSWMYDAALSFSDRLWVTRKNDTSHIFEYKSKDYFKNGTSKPIRLPYPFQGNGHIVYNGSFFYNPINRSSIFRFDLYSSSEHECERGFGQCELQLPGLFVNNQNFLFTPNHNFNYVDFNVDENGLWVIYGLQSNNTVVVKMDPVHMTIQHALNMSIDHHRFGEMFIAGGVLYAVHSVTEETMKIRLAFDLYKNTTVIVQLSFTNPYHKTTAVSYNHKTKDLYTWNKGNQLAYPIKYQGVSNITMKEDMRDMEMGH